MSQDALPYRISPPAGEEPREARRERLIREAKVRIDHALHESLDLLPSGWGEKIRQMVHATFQIGLETMADIAQPMVSDAELATVELAETLDRADAAAARLRELPAATVALAINGAIRYVLVERAEWALKRKFPRHEISLPREEAESMMRVVEAALSLDLDRLQQSDLFHDLP